ncbi:2OG-Fe dioxygenase family protein [Dyella lutea]|uniref:2OG-Fe dioxygenase family protein n=1 Tax=Dyella lutea TaxID=2950441 RepID=A0ABT1F7W8_9GAMM|nr:2OG-Fe dioxygenase family protein [Dyella lutea]MCP1373470.1 2OG-Fe dioxygenase family protein [Dyella lutea]
MPPPPDLTALGERLRRDGFAFLDAPVTGALLGAPAALGDWPAFAASWNDLAPDTYLAAQGRHRRRRHATFAVGEDGAIVRQPHQPHFQSLAYNRLQGDIQRWFEPIEPAVVEGDSLQRILTFSRDLFGALAPPARQWHVEVHQFRIEALPEQAGEPTPEGMHRDGVDYVLVLMIDRHNIASGTTTILASDGTELGSFTLTRPLDAALVDDARVFHGVTPVSPLDPAQPAHRDVLVVTFRAA